MKISFDSSEADIEFNDSETGRMIAAVLPFEVTAQVWKEEVYFEIPVTVGLENETATVEV